MSRPAVAVGEGEMPDGALSSEDEDVKKTRVSENKEKDALDQNLDM